MEITGNSSVNRGAYVHQGSRYGEKTEQGAAPASTKTEKQDKVVLSPQAREVQKAAESLRSEPDIRTDKVAAIRADIVNGTYNADSTETAFRMLKDSLVNAFF